MEKFPREGWNFRTAPNGGISMGERWYFRKGTNGKISAPRYHSFEKGGEGCQGKKVVSELNSLRREEEEDGLLNFVWESNNVSFRRGEKIAFGGREAADGRKKVFFLYAEEVVPSSSREGGNHALGGGQRASTTSLKRGMKGEGTFLMVTLRERLQLQRFGGGGCLGGKTASSMVFLMEREKREREYSFLRRHKKRAREFSINSSAREKRIAGREKRRNRQEGKERISRQALEEKKGIGGDDYLPRPRRGEFADSKREEKERKRFCLYV